VEKYGGVVEAIDNKVTRRMPFHVGYIRLQTHLEYIKRLSFETQQWLKECASILRHTYTGSVVKCDGT
jgi:hypothetical protein